MSRRYSDEAMRHIAPTVILEVRSNGARSEERVMSVGFAIMKVKALALQRDEDLSATVRDDDGQVLATFELGGWVRMPA